MNEKKQKWLAVSLLLLTAMFWGGGFIFQKYTTAIISSSFIVAARFTMASIALAIVCIKKLHLLQEDKGYLLGGAVTGVTMACGNLLQNLGMAYGTDAGKSAFLTAAYCVMVPFLGWLFFRRFPKRNHILSAVLCLAGIGLISLNTSSGIAFGDALTLISAIAFALNIVFVAHFCQGRDPIVLTMTQIWAAAISGWLVTIFTGGLPAETISAAAWGSLVYLGLFSTALCLAMESVGLKYTDPTVASILLSLESVFGVVFSVLVYHEVITCKVGIGFIIVFAAVILSQLPQRESVS